MASQASGSPKALTGAFHQPGYSIRSASRSATRRGQRGHWCGGSVAGRGVVANSFACGYAARHGAD